MVFQDAIEAEYRDVAATEFWNRFMMTIMAANAQAIKDLCSAKAEDVPKLQGRIFAYDKVIGLPDKVVRDSKGTPPEPTDAPERA